MTPEPIAIVGYGCRLPGGVVDGDSYWRLLAGGHDAITEVPPDRWSTAAYASDRPDSPGKSISRWGGFLDSVDGFEPECFGISPREAAYIDPQQRLLLETAWEMLERAGVPVSAIAGSRTGVYVGISTGDYAQAQRSTRGLRALSAFSAHGTTLGTAANRISYCFDLRGPSFAVDTACSSSLVALDHAVRGLRDGATDAALVGGVNVLLAPDPFVSFSRAAMLSPDGRCKPFDASANGFVRAEGAVVLLLKRLSGALRDGDPVRALILATGVNQDGRTGGLAVPSAEAQAALIRQVLDDAGQAPAAVGYVEAHGTGTAVGDPIEASALGEVFGPARPSDRPLLIGSVKSNIGHLEAGSGVASVLKVLLMFERGMVPPTLHLRTPNPNIRFDDWRLRVPTALEPWPAESGRLAAVNSFGFGGTNAHALLAAYSPPAPASTNGRKRARSAVPIVISARSPEALAELAGEWARALDPAMPAGAPEINAFAYSAALRRSHGAYRAGFAATDGAEARRRLLAIHESDEAPAPAPASATPPPVAFIFCGQGPQWHAQGRALLDAEPAFAHAFRACDQALREETGWSLLDELNRDPRRSLMDRTEVAQPAIFALQVALAALWRSRSVVPHVVVGHSVGEIAAAHVAGALSLGDAARLVARRGRHLQTSARPGRMIAAALTEDEAASWIERGVTLAAVNSPRLVTLAGEPAAVARVAERLERADIWVQSLNVRHAFHSPLVDPAREPFLASVAGVTCTPPECAMVSTVTGAVVDAALGPDYWWRNIREPVRFSDAIAELARLRVGVAIEIGPHPVLSAAIRQTAPELAVVPSLVRGTDDARTMLDSLARLFTLGVPVDWEAVWPERERFVALPPHPWRRRRFWHETPDNRRTRLPPSPHPLLGFGGDGPRPTWYGTMDTADPAWLADHRIGDRVVVPAAALLEMLLAAGSRALGTDGCELSDVHIRRGLFPAGESGIEVATSADAGTGTVSIASRVAGDEGEWTDHCVAGFGPVALKPAPADGRVGVPTGSFAGNRLRSGETVRPDILPGDDAPDRPKPLQSSDSAPAQANGFEPVSTTDFYADLESIGLTYGPAFRGVRGAAVHRDGGCARAFARLDPAAAGDDSGFAVHPALLDACLQPVHLVLPEPLRARKQLYLPERFERVRFKRPPGSSAWTEVRLLDASPLVLRADVRVFTGSGELALEIDGFTCRAVARPDADEEFARCSFALRWIERPVSAAERESILVDEPALNWLVVAGRRSHIGSRLAGALRAAGYRTVLATIGEAARRVGPDRYRLGPGGAGLARLRACDALRAGDYGVVYLAPTEPHSSGGGPDARAVEVCTPLTAILRELAGERGDGPRMLVVATAGGQPLDGDTGDVERALQAAAIGMGRVAATEYPELDVRLVDLDPASDSVEPLLAEIRAADAQEETAWRAGRRYVPRAVPLAEVEAEPAAPTPAGTRRASPPYALVPRRRGDLGSVEAREIAGERPGPGEVLVEVGHAALNFRDVLKVLGTYPADDPADFALGDECAGIVRAVGRRVRRVAPGDAVVVLRPGSLRSELVVPATSVCRLPNGLDATAAVTIPVAFLTATHALREIARLRSGETVLIHAAAGGVGLAALQIAQGIGARVFATAGSPEKRALLRELGAELVADSRDLAFAREVRRATGGRGVDVVLNSLAGRAMLASLELLAPGGRFVEIGSRDFEDNTRVGIRALRENRSYHSVALAPILLASPARAARQVERLLHAAAKGEIRPLPHTVEPAAHVTDALRRMARGAHTGKIVLDMSAPGEVVRAWRPLRIRPDATYLVTGAFGGVGAELTRRLVDAGARHLILLGRRGPTSDAARRALDAARNAGARVVARAVDVADADALASLLRETDRSLPPLAGVFHLAMVLDDATIANTGDDRLRRVLRPKVAGAWNLHRLTAARRLDHFVLFGSAAATFGNFGQGAYAAANAALDALAGHRRALGLPATTMAWGMLGEVGCIADDPALGAWLARAGVQPISQDEVWRALGTAAASTEPVHVVLRADWARLGAALGGGSRRPGIFEARVSAGDAAAHSTDGDLRAALVAANPGDRLALATRFTRTAVARVLGASPATLDADRPLLEFGLDSLMAVELAQAIDREFGGPVPIAGSARDLTVTSLAEKIVRLASDAAETTGGDDGGQAEDLAGVPPAESPEPAVSTAGARRNGAAARVDDGRELGGVESNGKSPRSSPGAHITATGSRFTAEPRLVHLAGDRAAPRVYCFHPAGGDLAAYESLAHHLGQTLGVFGIESRLLAGAPEEFASVADMATAYARIVADDATGTGPAALVGFSIGGLAAVHAARALEHEGRAIGVVAMIECDLEPPPASVYTLRCEAFLAALVERLDRGFGLLPPGAAPTMLAEAPALASELVTASIGASGKSGDGQRPETPMLDVTSAEGVTRRIERWLLAGGRLRDGAPVADIGAYVHALALHFRLYARARFGADGLQAPLMVWGATRGIRGELAGGAMGRTGPDGLVRWNHGPIDFHRLDTDHFGIMQPPHAAVVARRILERLLAAVP